MGRVSTEIKVIKGEPFVLRSVMENSIFSNVLPSFHPSDTSTLLKFRVSLPVVLSLWNCSPSRDQVNRINIFGGKELQEDKLQNYLLGWCKHN